MGIVYITVLLHIVVSSHLHRGISGNNVTNKSCLNPNGIITSIKFMTFVLLEPGAFNAESQYFIPLFNKIS
jgi:hypothetical protein